MSTQRLGELLVRENLISSQQLQKAQEELETYKNQLEQKVQEEIKKRREQERILIQQTKLAAMGEMIGIFTESADSLRVHRYGIENLFSCQDQQNGSPEEENRRAEVKQFQLMVQYWDLIWILLYVNGLFLFICK